MSGFGQLGELVKRNHAGRGSCLDLRKQQFLDQIEFAIDCAVRATEFLGNFVDGGAFQSPDGDLFQRVILEAVQEPFILLGP